MRKTLLIILLLVIAVAGAWFLSVREDQKAVERVQVAPPPVAEAEPQPEPPRIVHPVEQISVAPAPEPLPALADSDSEVTGQLAELLGPEPVELLFLADQVVSRVVASVDSLASAKVAPMMLPVVPAEGRFQVLEGEDETVVSPLNAARYDAYVSLVDGLDSEQAVALYARYYPLFQQAYQEQGYPGGYFNDRLVEVIDLLLATPEPAGPLGLVRNEAVWEFEDPQLEALAAGQKVLLRMGNDNARIVKAKLREVRALITGPSGPSIP